MGCWLLTSPVSRPACCRVALQGGPTDTLTGCEFTRPRLHHLLVSVLFLRSPSLMGEKQILLLQFICLITRKVECPCVYWPFAFCEVALASSVHVLLGFGFLINL